MSKGYQLLIETVAPATAGIVVEEVQGQTKKDLWIAGVFAQTAVRNQNQRIYPRNQMEKAIEEALARLKATNGILGELDHPSSLNINLDRVSHVVTEMHLQGDDVIGRAKILGGEDGTPMGKIAESLIRHGVQLGVSTRGTGTVNEATGEVGDFTLLTYDIVANPSAPNAYPKAVMEALQYAKNVNTVVDLSTEMRNNASAQKHFKREILKAIQQLTESGLMTVRKK